MIDARFRPLTWDGPSTPAHERRSRWTFKASWSSTLDLLDRELQHLDAADVVIEADFREGDIRLDGWPRANARQPAHPGVRIAFGSVHGPLVYATDSCEHWQHNVRSIALGLEALRAVDRYGVTRRGEQYTGWRQIGSGPAITTPVFTSAPAAWNYLLDAAGIHHPPGTPEHLPSVPGYEIRRVITRAQRRSHPDLGGDPATFQMVQAAASLIEGGDQR